MRRGVSVEGAPAECESGIPLINTKAPKKRTLGNSESVEVKRSGESRAKDQVKLTVRVNGIAGASSAAYGQGGGSGWWVWCGTFVFFALFTRATAAVAAT